MLILVFIFFYFQAVRALYAARVTQATSLLHRLNIPTSQIKSYLSELLEEKKGLENIESEKELLDYIKVRAGKGNGFFQGQNVSLTETTTCLIKEIFDNELKKMMCRW